MENISDAEMSEELGLSDDELKTQISALLRKFGVRRRADLMLLRLSNPISNVA
jgi:DNA-binding CsgD family transcriptional regulator